MPFPQSRRVVFENNPLTEVICQLRFPAILEIGAEDPAEFQKRIRRAYPLYETDNGGTQLPKEISSLIEQLRLPHFPQTVRPTHKFSSEDSSRSISLSTDFVAVTDRGYTRWEQFRVEIRRAKEVLEDVYGPAFYSRVGLRYQDTIDREKLGIGEEPWDSLINPQLLGALGARDIEREVEEISTVALVTVNELDGGFVRIRHGLMRSEGRRAYVIDSDFYTEARRAKDDVLAALDTFGRIAGNLFRWATTDRLREALKPTPLE